MAQGTTNGQRGSNVSVKSNLQVDTHLAHKQRSAKHQNAAKTSVLAPRQKEALGYCQLIITKLTLANTDGTDRQIPDRRIVPNPLWTRPA